METKYLNNLCRKLCAATLELIEETPDTITLTFEIKEDNRFELKGTNTLLDIKNFQGHLERVMEKMTKFLENVKACREVMLENDLQVMHCVIKMEDENSFNYTFTISKDRNRWRLLNAICLN